MALSDNKFWSFFLQTCPLINQPLCSGRKALARPAQWGCKAEGQGVQTAVWDVVGRKRAQLKINPCYLKCGLLHQSAVASYFAHNRAAYSIGWI